MAEAAEVAAGRVVFAMCRQSAITGTQVPSGDGVAYIGNADVLATRGANKPASGVVVASDAGTLKAHGSLDIPTDLTPRGTAATGQAQAAAQKTFVGQVQTVGNVTGGLFTIDLAGVDFGSGIYQFEFYVQINNVTDTTGAILKCTGGWQNRAGTVTGIVFPYTAGTDTAQGAGGNTTAKIQPNLAGALVGIDANPGAGNVGKTLDWSGWCIVRRSALT
jgi:hypothetical protein